MALLCVAVCFLADQVRDLLSYSQWYTDEDQTLLWFAGRGLVHLQIHSPSVIGANYNTIYESLPGALIHLAGVSLRIASPLGVAGMVTVIWALPALAAWRRGQTASAILAMALPVCLSVPYLLAEDQLKGVATGDLCAAGAVAVSIIIRREQRRLTLMILLAGMGFVWDNASVIVTAPALMAAVVGDLTELRRNYRRSLLSVCGGALLPAVILVLNHFWYASHPGSVVSPKVDTSFHLSVLWGHLVHPGPLFGFFAPELLRASRVALAWVIGVPTGALIVGLFTRRVEPVIAATTFLVVMGAVLSVADTGSNYQPSLYLSGARFLFLMPMGVWVVAHHAIDVLSAPRTRTPAGVGPLRHRRAIPAVAVLALLAAASTGVAQASFRSQVKPLIHFGVSNRSGVQMQSAAGLLADCSSVTRLYHAYRAQILVSLDQPFAYGCAAQSGVNTLFPPYDRRSWLVRAAYVTPVSRILLWGGINCQEPPLARGVGACTPLAAGAELLVTPRRRVASTLSRMGWTVYRPRQ